MTKKIFRSICLVAICVVLSVMAIIMGVMYNYYSDLQAQRLDKQVEYVVYRNKTIKEVLHFFSISYRADIIKYRAEKRFIRKMKKMGLLDKMWD